MPHGARDTPLGSAYLTCSVDDTPAGDGPWPVII